MGGAAWQGRFALSITEAESRIPAAPFWISHKLFTKQRAVNDRYLNEPVSRREYVNPFSYAKRLQR